MRAVHASASMPSASTKTPSNEHIRLSCSVSRSSFAVSRPVPPCLLPPPPSAKRGEIPIGQYSFPKQAVKAVALLLHGCARQEGALPTHMRLCWPGEQAPDSGHPYTWSPAKRGQRTSDHAHRALAQSAKVFEQAPVRRTFLRSIDAGARPHRLRERFLGARIAGPGRGLAQDDGIPILVLHVCCVVIATSLHAKEEGEWAARGEQDPTTVRKYPAR